MTAECAAGPRCVVYRPGERPGAVRPDGGPLCDGCLGRAVADLRALPWDYARLRGELVRSGGGVGPHVSGGDPDAPVPLALAVDALQRDIAWTLTVWEVPVREAAGLPCPPDGAVRPGWAVARAAGTLAACAPVLAALGPTWGYADGLDAGPVERTGVDAVKALSELHQAAERALGTTRHTRRVQGLCGDCGAAALVRVDGDDAVTCRVCGQSQSLDQYEAYVGLLVAGALTGPRVRRAGGSP